MPQTYCYELYQMFRCLVLCIVGSLPRGARAVLKVAFYSKKKSFFGMSSKVRILMKHTKWQKKSILIIFIKFILQSYNLFHVLHRPNTLLYYRTNNAVQYWHQRNNFKYFNFYWLVEINKTLWTCSFDPW